MEGFTDLLTDAFSETSIPSFPDEDLDFENLHFDEKSDEDGTKSLTTNKEAALLQEATGEAAALFETKETAENVYEEQSDGESDEEDFEGEGVSAINVDKTPEEDYASSDADSGQESSISGEDDDEDEDEEEDIGTAETPGDLLMSVRCSDEFNDGNKEDEIFAEGQPLAPEDAESPQVRNKEQGEAESDEDVSYLKRIPGRGDETVIKPAETGEDQQESEEEKEEDSSDPECEGMKIELEENVTDQPFEEEEVENIYRDDPEEGGSEFPHISSQNLQDLTGEVDNGEYAEKMKDFSGDEHQEAGESFADYPSDFSSCEYAEDGRKIQESRSNFWPGASEYSLYAQDDMTQMGSAEDSDEKEDGYLYSRDLEMDAENLMSLGVAIGEQVRSSTVVTKFDDEEETTESDCSSSDDEARRCLQVLKNNKQPVDSQIYAESGSDDHHISNNRADQAGFLSWDFDVLKTDTFLDEYLLSTEDMTETPLTDVNQHRTEYTNSYSDAQREVLKTTSPSYQGSLDDSFFFNTGVEASGITQPGQLEEEEYEEDRNWDQEEKRIKAFNDFYGDGDEENGREGRQIKVQFCAEPLSQVIHYETDSDRDSLSSSTDSGKEDLSSAESSDEPREPDVTLQVKPVCDLPKVQLPENAPDLSNKQTCPEKHKGASVMKLILTLSLVTVMGLLMFWLATDQGEWLNQVFFF